MSEFDQITLFLTIVVLFFAWGSMYFGYILAKYEVKHGNEWSVLDLFAKKKLKKSKVSSHK